MTEEELQQIRERVNTQLGLVLPKDVSLETSRTIRQLFSDRAGLLTEVERLREIVGVVATMDAMQEDGNGWEACVFQCGAGELGQPDHIADCPVTKARQLLGV